jgi:hypothetical protein
MKNINYYFKEANKQIKKEGNDPDEQCTISRMSFYAMWDMLDALIDEVNKLKKETKEQDNDNTQLRTEITKLWEKITNLGNLGV